MSFKDNKVTKSWVKFRVSVIFILRLLFHNVTLVRRFLETFMGRVNFKEVAVVS